MRIKNLLLIIAAFVLLISASAQAEYEQYRLTEPSEKYAEAYVTVYPLDPHNVIVRMAPPEEAPWRVDWYRDGQLIRSLSATGDYDRVSPASPIIERDGSFSMLCRIPGRIQETEKFPQLNATAQWADEGLSYISPLKEQLKAARCGNRTLNESLQLAEDKSAERSSSELLEAFLAVKRLEGRSDKTLALYRCNIGMIPGISDKNACVMTTDDIRKCLAQYQEEHGINKAIQKLLFPSFSRSIMI